MENKTTQSLFLNKLPTHAYSIPPCSHGLLVQNMVEYDILKQTSFNFKGFEDSVFVHFTLKQK
jgi:hypothetical protein